MSKNIDIRVHNRKTLEIKLEYVPKGAPEKSDYYIELYLFLPENMGINPSTYEKKYFYNDLFRSIRLKSPDYIMNNYYSRLKNFDENCKDDRQTEKCEYIYKKFICGYRSMIRSTLADISKQSSRKEIKEMLSNIRKNRSIFRKLRKKFGESHNMFVLGDEFSSIVSNVYLVRLYEKLGHYGNEDILATIKSELKYRKKHYPESLPGDDEKNGILINRYDYLKGYFYNVLSLRAKRKAGDKAMKNILYAVAAGVSMVFATVIAFWAQYRYGNFTLPFFAALVVGYMFKDRIKDGFRSLFEKAASPVIFDYITLLYESKGEHHMGKTSEKAEFISSEDLPEYVPQEKINGCRILRFIKKVHIENGKIKRLLDPEIHGISDIMRLNTNRLTSGLEEPLALMYSVNDDTLEKKFAEKIYSVEVFVRVAATGDAETLRGILTLSAKGIKNFRII